MPGASSAPAAGDRLLSAQIFTSLEHRPALLRLLRSSSSAPRFWHAEAQAGAIPLPVSFSLEEVKQQTLHLHPRRHFQGKEFEEETVFFCCRYNIWYPSSLFQVLRRLILHHPSLTQVSGPIISQHRLQKGYSSTGTCSIGNPIREWDM